MLTEQKVAVDVDEKRPRGQSVHEEAPAVVEKLPGWQDEQEVPPVRF